MNKELAKSTESSTHFCPSSCLIRHASPFNWITLFRVNCQLGGWIVGGTRKRISRLEMFVVLSDISAYFVSVLCFVGFLMDISIFCNHLPSIAVRFHKDVVWWILCAQFCIIKFNEWILHEVAILTSQTYTDTVVSATYLRSFRGFLWPHNRQLSKQIGLSQVNQNQRLHRGEFPSHPYGKPY